MRLSGSLGPFYLKKCFAWEIVLVVIVVFLLDGVRKMALGMR